VFVNANFGFEGRPDNWDSLILDMEARMDFLDRLGTDLSSEILTYLDDPSDLFRVSRVSRSWRHLGELKQLNVF
jgi:hypothetical protein